MFSHITLVKALLVAALAVLFAGGTLLSENASGLRGKVVYQFDRKPIHNAYVLVHQNAATDAHVRTDENGKYLIELPVGTYDVFISAEGYSPICRKVEIEADGMMIFDAGLEFSDVGMQKD